MAAGRSGLRGLNARRVVGEECEREHASAKRQTNSTETALDVHLINKRATSTLGALQRQQLLPRRLLLPRSGQDGLHGQLAHRLVATERKHENELALTPLILDNLVSANESNRDTAMHSLAQQRSSQQQPRGLQNGQIGRTGLLARELAMLEHARELDTAKDHSAQVQEIRHKNVAGKCVQLIRQKQQPRKIHLCLQIIQNILIGATGQHVPDHAAEAASTELDNANQDTVLGFCDRIKLVTGHHAQRLQRPRLRQPQQQLVITGAHGDHGENVFKLFSVDENIASANA